MIDAPGPRNLAKSFYLLGITIDNLFRRMGVERVLFVTLTFPDHVTSVREAHRRLNSLLNKLRKRYGNFVWVLQPHRSGRIHYHLLIPVQFDCHKGTLLNAWSELKAYSPADRLHAMNPELRAESDWWTKAAEAHGFGVSQVAPVYSDGVRVRKYLQNRRWATQHWPFVERKSIRFWSCSKGLRSGSTNFSWNTTGGKIYRQKLAEYAATENCTSLDQLRRKLGRYWGWYYLQWRLLNDSPESPEELEIESQSKEVLRSVSEVTLPQADCRAITLRGSKRPARGDCIEIVPQALIEASSSIRKHETELRVSQHGSPFSPLNNKSVPMQRVSTPSALAKF